MKEVFSIALGVIFSINGFSSDRKQESAVDLVHQVYSELGKQLKSQSKIRTETDLKNYLKLEDEIVKELRVIESKLKLSDPISDFQKRELYGYKSHFWADLFPNGMPKNREENHILKDIPKVLDEKLEKRTREDLKEFWMLVNSFMFVENNDVFLSPLMSKELGSNFVLLVSSGVRSKKPRLSINRDLSPKLEDPDFIGISIERKLPEGGSSEFYAQYFDYPKIEENGSFDVKEAVVVDWENHRLLMKIGEISHDFKLPAVVKRPKD